MRATDDIENRDLSFRLHVDDILPMNKFRMRVILGAVLTFAGQLLSVMGYNVGFMATAGSDGYGLGNPLADRRSTGKR
jgi:hypothetical protein